MPQDSAQVVFRSSARARARQSAVSESVQDEPHNVAQGGAEAGDVVVGESDADVTSSKAVWTNVALVFAGTWAVTRLRMFSIFEELVALFVALIFLYGALRPLGRSEAVLTKSGVWLGGLFAPPKSSREKDPFGLFDLVRLLREGFVPGMRELFVALFVAAITFPPFFVGFRIYNEVTGFPTFEVPSEFVFLVLGHLFVVAFPEEVYFRGFLQTHFRKKHSLVVALLIQSALFAAIHFVVDFHPARLAVFFPGLVFGLLREWRGGVGAAIFYHALCNVYADLLLRGYGVV